MGDETPATPAPDLKPGWKTTEFWLSTAAMIVSALLTFLPSDSPVMKYVGIAGLVLTSLGYTVTRTGVKKAAQILLIVLIPLAFVSCNKGMIRADAIKGLNADVCDRHDAMINGKVDPKSMSEADKATYLRSSALLRKAIQEAQQ